MPRVGWSLSQLLKGDSGSQATAVVLPGSLPIVVKIVLLGLLSTEPPVPGGWNWN